MRYYRVRIPKICNVFEKEEGEMRRKEELISISEKFVEKHYKTFSRNFSNKRLERLTAIEVGVEKKKLIIKYWARRLLITIGIAVGIVLMILLWMLASAMSNQDTIYSLPRASPGGEDRTSQIVVEAGDSNKLREITIAPRVLTEKQMKEEFARAEKYVKKVILGENKSLEHISKSLVLLNEIPDSPLTLSWELDQDGLIQKDGSILWKKIKKKKQTEIFLTMTYGDEQKSVAFEMMLVPPKKGIWEKFWVHWEEVLAKKNNNTKHNKNMELPRVVDGLKLKYHKPKDNSWKYLLFLGGFMLLMIPVLMDQKQEKEITKRKEQLQLAYPEFIEQFVLLMGAGLTLRGAWGRMCDKYLQKKSQNEQAFHYLYEEMVVTMREMDNGVGEQKAYEMFGKRTEMLIYMKFCSLIVQNLKKGSADLLGLLEYEAVDAFAKRKENAKALGEKAGTKLLMPMMLMLLIVFIIILYSAFQSM